MATQWFLAFFLFRYQFVLNQAKTSTQCYNFFLILGTLLANFVILGPAFSLMYEVNLLLLAAPWCVAAYILVTLSLVDAKLEDEENKYFLDLRDKLHGGGVRCKSHR